MSRSGRSILLFCHKSAEGLARQIVQSTAAKKAERGSEGLFRSIEFRNAIDWKTFPDGWPNLFIESVKECAGKDVIFLANFSAPETVFEQLSVVYAFPRYLAHSFTIILPYFPTGTMERVDKEGQIATAKTLAILLSAIPLAALGPAQIVIYDIHALQERFYFADSVIPRLETAIPLLLQRLSSVGDKEHVHIAFPDDGAFKRFSGLFDGYEMITCVKRREGTKRIVSVKDGNPSGKHVIIVDDLVQTGGTLVECAKALLSQGAKEVSAYVTHAVFPKESWRRFAWDGGVCEVRLSHFWFTDSLPGTVHIANNKPFEVLSLTDVISEMLMNYDLRL
eukprot:m.53996 g.53996  ORF g.53996 m.53996 type:complete len:336 (+) comp34301_c0_seq2:60-1067(+)